MRILAISDIHGMYDDFCALLNKVNYNSKDMLILLGDYIDRGPKPIETILLIMHLVKKRNAIALQGNHEWVFNKVMRYYRNNLLTLLKNEHLMSRDSLGVTIKSLHELALKDEKFANEVIDFIKTLPIIKNYKNYIFVHAGYKPYIPLNNQSVESLLFARGKFMNNRGVKGKKIIFGHTPTKNNNYRIWHDPIYKDKINIDCGAVYGGYLACLDLTNKKEYYVKTKGV